MDTCIHTEKQNRDRNLLFNVLLIITLILAGWVRFYGIQWDQGTHLHPDERYLTMVASAIRFPDELDASNVNSVSFDIFKWRTQYWNTPVSSLNPANYEQFASYVYGTLPLFTTRLVGRFINLACQPDYMPDNLSVYLARGLRLLFLNTMQPCVQGEYTGYSGIHLVGRALSAVTDLITLLGLVLLACSLYGDRVAILSGILYAFTVLPIQHAHFFVVDSFATVFVMWTLYFCVSAHQRHSPTTLILAGAMTGLAVASKISVWPLAGIVGLSGILIMLEDTRGKQIFKLRVHLPVVISLLLSGICAAVLFRIGQPYAFQGPGFFNVSINPHWLATMKDIRELMSGLRDVPFGHQWTDRQPIIFPLKNMVVWGMGLPLGVAAWLGWGTMGWQIWVKNRIQHAIPWIWGTAFFLYQGTQWVKSMRYLLPIYPIFIVMASWFLIHVVLPDKKYTRGRHFFMTAFFRKVLYFLIICGTFLWALGFLRIYSQPLTRVSASQWMYENIPTAVTLNTTSGLIQVPLRTPVTLFTGIPVTARIPDRKADVTITGVTLNKYKNSTPAFSTLNISIDNHILTNSLVNHTTTYASTTLDLNQPIVLSAGNQYDITLLLESGDPVELASSVIANEHWDDPLPQRLGGKDPFWNWYQSLTTSPGTQMNNYDNDNNEKRDSLLSWLDEADYIVLSSNRLYGSIPRLPLRYPLTTEYYKLLFSGDLGFHLLAEFVSYPSLGPCQFPDQEIPFPLMDAVISNRLPCSLNLPPAEEAFSVYDHPTVLIFEKTEAYSPEKVASLLKDSLLHNVQWMTPREATKKQSQPAPSLLMDQKTRIEQESGGTWSDIFNRDALQNKYPFVSAVSWWLLITLLGWVAYPWVFSIFTNLHFRGYGLSKSVGLLLWAYVCWILASLHIAPYTRTTIWMVFLLLVFVMLVFNRKNHRSLIDYVRREWRQLLRMEIIFTVLYVAWVMVRYANPDLWHPVTGGEKPMDFAYLNAIIKSKWFPPYDPWFAGGKLNYYYFGFVLVGTLAKATGIIPSIAYNLAVPSFFALTGMGVYTVAANLSGKDTRRGNRAGILGILLITILGNLGEARLLFKGYQDVGNIQFESLIPGYPAVVSELVGLWKVVVEKIPLGFRPEWWYWDATRVIPVWAGEVGPINEFPAFTFLYADLHAHMMAFPLTLVALAVAIQWALEKPTPLSPEAGWFSGGLTAEFKRLFSGVLFAGLVAGSLRATNTWDYPTYLALISLGALLPVAWNIHLKNSLDFPFRIQSKFWLLRLLVPVLTFAIAELMFLPFTRHYAVAYSSFEQWKGSRTPLGIYFIMYGQFLFPLLLAAVSTGGYLLHHRKEMKLPMPRALFILFGIGTIILWGIFLLVLEVPVAWFAIPFGLLALVFVISTGVSIRHKLIWLWVGTALALSLFVEFIVLKGDIGRMNTVFKFYLQVWMLLGLSSAVFIESILEHSLKPSQAPTWVPQRYYNSIVDLVTILLAILIFSAGLYPALAIPAKIRDRWAPGAPASLDGAAFIPYAIQEEHGSRMSLAADYQVIQWLQDNVEGSPTIMEAQAEREYLWGARISIHTGLPAVAAWRWHQVQQRMTMPAGTVEERQHAVRLFYNTSDPDKAMDILDEYQVKYVILTPYERAYMVPDGYAKFSVLINRGVLSKVFDNGDATIYQVN